MLAAVSLPSLACCLSLLAVVVSFAQSVTVRLTAFLEFESVASLQLFPLHWPVY
jgi:hypothetical protein